MKKAMLLFSAVVLFAGLTFAQTPQVQDKAPKPADKSKKECTHEPKSGCDQKTKASCLDAKKSGCCAKDAKKPAPAPTPVPEKK